MLTSNRASTSSELLFVCRSTTKYTTMLPFVTCEWQSNRRIYISRKPVRIVNRIAIIRYTYSKPFHELMLSAPTCSLRYQQSYLFPPSFQQSRPTSKSGKTTNRRILQVCLKIDPIFTFHHNPALYKTMPLSLSRVGLPPELTALFTKRKEGPILGTNLKTDGLFQVANWTISRTFIYSPFTSFWYFIIMLIVTHWQLGKQR